MDVTFKDGIIMDLSRQWVKPVEEGSGKLVITEPVTALLSFIDIIGEERSNGTLADDDTVIVESIRLVYYVDKDSVSGNILYDTAFPSWRIEYNGGRIKYISAFEQ